MKLIKKEKIETKRSYDISVKDTNSFFVNGILVHNSNAAICYNTVGGLWAQSKENIITLEADNMGFAFFVETNKTAFHSLIDKIIDATHVDTVMNTISIFGEWCGGNIQKGVGVSNLPKSFFIFGVKISPIVDKNDKEAVKANPAYWVDSTYLKFPEAKIYNIADYKTFSIEIDFNMPQLIQNELSELTIAVEEECPVAKSFGFSVLENNTAYEDENGNIWFENESLPNFTNPIKDKLKSIFKENRVKNPNGVNFIRFSLK